MSTNVPTLSNRQRAILAFITDHLTSYGYPPSVREIAEELDLSIGAVHHQLVELELKGYLRRVPGRSRAIQVIEPKAAA